MRLNSSTKRRFTTDAKWPKTKRSRWGKWSMAENHGSHVPVWVVDLPVTLDRNETCWGGSLFSFEFPGWALYNACLDLFVLDIARYSSVCVCTVNGYHLPSILVWFAQGQVGLWLHVTQDVYPYTVFHVNVQLYFCFSSTCKCHLAAGTCCCTAIRPLHGLVVIIQTQQYDLQVIWVFCRWCYLWHMQHLK